MFSLNKFSATKYCIRPPRQTRFRAVHPSRLNMVIFKFQQVRVVTYPTRIDANNVEDILKDYEIVIDGSDNLATRYLVNEACVRMGLPSVHGAVHRFEGQVTVFWNREGGSVKDEGNDQASPCYRCLYPEPPSSETAPSCSEAGVLGVLPGIIGLLQAIETIKILLDIGQPLIGKILYYDALSSSFMQVGLKQNKKCPCCSEKTHYSGYTDYQHSCTLNRCASKKSGPT
jgi:molybdopterin/thiamine biosynthesis adenylyltransferase